MFVHDASDADLGLRAGVVTLVDVRPSGHEVGIRLTTGTRTGSVIRPDGSPSTSPPWRTTTAGVAAIGRPQRPGIGLAPARAPSGSVIAVAVLSAPASMTAEQ